MKIGKKLKEARLKKRLSQEQLGKMVGVSRATISKWESDLALPTRVNYPKLAKALDVPMEIMHPIHKSNINILDLDVDMKDITLVDWKDLDNFLSNKDGTTPNMGSIIKVSADLGLELFGALVEDNSMFPIMHSKDILVIDEAATIKSNDYVVVKINSNNEFILRKYVDRGVNSNHERVYDLIAENPDYVTITCNGENQGRIIGKVVEHRRQYL